MAHRPLGDESLQRKNQSASPDNNRDFLLFINSSGRTCPLTPSCPLHQGMAVPSDHMQNFGRRERRKTIEASTKGAGLHLGAVQKATLVRLNMRWIEAVRTHSEREGGS
jgi:hypothetical protein